MPEWIPELNPEQLANWSKLSYVDLVKEIVSLFISQQEIPENDLKDLIHRAFEKSFSDGEPVKLTCLKGKIL